MRTAAIKEFASEDEALLEIDRWIAEGWLFTGHYFRRDQVWHLQVEKEIEGERVTQDIGMTARPLAKMFFLSTATCPEVV